MTDVEKVKLYTKTGDKGTTSLLDGSRVDKDSLRVSSYGTVDELNAILGLTAQFISGDMLYQLRKIQYLLFEVGSELASVKPRHTITETDVKYLEQLIDASQKVTPPLTNFILPGGSKAGSWFHLARTAARRAERSVVTLSKENEVDEHLLKWINRLGDLLFAWARETNQNEGVPDLVWKSRKSEETKKE